MGNTHTEERKPSGKKTPMWHDDRLAAIINWNDPVVKHGLDHRITYTRLLRHRASSPRARGADRQGERYVVQLVLAGVPLQKPKHTVGTDTVDLGPSSIAIVPQQAEARLEQLCAELRPDARAIRRLQRKLAAHRKSLHGRLVHQIVAVGHTIITEKLSQSRTSYPTRE